MRNELRMKIPNAMLAYLASSARAGGEPKPDRGLANIPSQKGRTFLVTGGASGMGFENASALAAAGAQVIIAARSPHCGVEAIEAIKQQVPGAKVQFEAVDLANLASVRALAGRLKTRLSRLDALINSAAMMPTPRRVTSPDGFEMQLATNYLGHFVLTAELLPLLVESDSPRVVTLSGVAAMRGRIDFDDLQAANGYDAYAVYTQSILACLMFALELQKLSDAADWGILSIAAQGAPSTLFAATAPDAQGGAYYGSTRGQEMRGPLGLAMIPPAAMDAASVARLWDLTEEITGTRLPAR